MADPDMAVVLHEMGQLEISEGNVKTAEELFRQSLAATVQLQSDQAEGEGEEDSWETEWESNLEQLAPPKTPIPEVKKKATRPKAAKARESPAQEAESPSRFQRGSAASSSTPERPLEYGGEHILEVFGLSVDRGTKELEDLAEVLGDVGALSPAIRWVDDNHALIIFPDAASARRALLQKVDGFTCRKFSEASPAAREMPVSELRPPKPRPETSSAVARRLIGHALGNMSSLRDKDAEKKLRGQRQEKDVARKVKAQELESAWED